MFVSTESPSGPPRVLLVQTRGRSTVSRAERRRRQTVGDEPRGMLLEQELGCEVLDEASLADVDGWRSALYRHIPAFLAQALEAAIRARRFDVVLTWSERHSVAVAAIFALLRIRTPHLALMFWISKPVVRIPLRLFGSGVDRIVTWSSVQRRVAINDVGFRAEDVVLVKHPVDLTFYRPVPARHEVIFSAGSTQRDFETLATAVRGVNVSVRIAASLVVALKGLKIHTRDVRADLRWPDNVRVESMTALQVRECYAKAKVVVVPLIPSDIDAGVNVILEAMAMGRPVIASRTVGQVDVIEDGKNGLYVPPSDPGALRAAIAHLVENQVQAEELGARARAYVEANHSLEEFVQRICDEVSDLGAKRSLRRWRRSVAKGSRETVSDEGRSLDV